MLGGFSKETIENESGITLPPGSSFGQAADEVAPEDAPNRIHQKLVESIRGLTPMRNEKGQQAEGVSATS